MTTRRNILRATAAGAGLAATSTASASASGSGSGDKDDDTETTGQDQDDCADDNSCGSSDYCPLANTIEIRTTIDSNKPVRYTFAVTGQIELPSGQRVAHCKGQIEAEKDSRYKREFAYSGELKYLRVTGPGSACLDQPAPCNDN